MGSEMCIRDRYWSNYRHVEGDYIVTDRVLTPLYCDSALDLLSPLWPKVVLSELEQVSDTADESVDNQNITTIEDHQIKDTGVLDEYTYSCA